MKPENIFAPVSVLALWTWTVLLLTGFRRVRGVATGRIPRGAFRVGDSPAVPVDVVVFNRNLMNLLEMPLLFYVVCIALYVTRKVAPGLVGLAWCFVGLRIAHSAIHLGSNRILPRFAAFASSNLVLLAIWLWFIYLVF